MFPSNWEHPRDNNTSVNCLEKRRSDLSLLLLFFVKIIKFNKFFLKKISIIIPTLNEATVLPNLIGTIKSQQLKFSYEVIVCDFNSTDSTRKIAKEAGFKIVDGGVPSVARNIGARHATTELFVFIDADVTFDNFFLQKALDSFEKKGLDVAGGYFKITRGKISYIINILINNIAKRFRQMSKSPVLTGDFIICKKEVFCKLGGFDENLKIGEDIDFATRAVAAGYRFAHVAARYITSPRRIEKIGLLRLTFAFACYTFYNIQGRHSKVEVQTKIEKIYGAVGAVK
jgi:glycosyltransferase involved in cell wall biosynthesis